MDSYDDRIEWLEEQSVILGKDMARFDITLLDDEGTPISDILLQGITGIDGSSAIMTNAYGEARGYSTQRTANIKIAPYADLTPSSKQISNIAGQRYTVSLTSTHRNYFSTFNTTNIYFSNLVERVDYSVCGGGGSGSSTPYTSKYGKQGGGGGGGGGYCKTGVMESVIANQPYPVSIGAGGSNLNYSSGNPPGNDGGASSFNGTTAPGGEGGGDKSNNLSSDIGGTGNGNGGNGAPQSGSGSASSGYSGSGVWYTSYSSSTAAGGGGGGGYQQYINSDSEVLTPKPGGSPYGRAGAVYTSYMNKGGIAAQNGDQPGGGGGGAYGSTTILGYDKPGAGGSGGVSFRIHFKTLPSLFVS